MQRGPPPHTPTRLLPEALREVGEPPGGPGLTGLEKGLRRSAKAPAAAGTLDRPELEPRWAGQCKRGREGAQQGPPHQARQLAWETLGLRELRLDAQEREDCWR